MLRLVFGFRDRVDRATYLRVGLGLMIFKYLSDAAAIYLVTGLLWSPLDYLTPVEQVRSPSFFDLPAWLVLSLMAWALPFLWIGVSMTIRRAVDAGRTPWLGLLFFAPFINYLLMLVLCVLPSSPRETWNRGPIVAAAEAQVGSALLGIGAAALVGVAGTTVSVFFLDAYGFGLFLGVPFFLGLVCAFVFNHGHPRTAMATIRVTLLSLLVIAGALLLFALEGIVCIAMAFPIAVALAVPGALVGREIAIRAPGAQRSAAVALLMLPGVALWDATVPEPRSAKVITTVEIDAPPEDVWGELIAFDEIDAPRAWYFRIGLAYPMRAKIHGSGVGAVRHCVFSTGPFIEPITAWETGRRLAFDVISQPPPMQEWSPYAQVYAPHLDGFFRTSRGELRIVPLPGGRSRLEGSAPGTSWRSTRRPTGCRWRSGSCTGCTGGCWTT